MCPNHYFLSAGISAEADKIDNVAATIGRKRLGVVYSDGASGQEALHQIANIGGVGYDFSNGRREGSSFVEIGIISSRGKLVNCGRTILLRDA